MIKQSSIDIVLATASVEEIIGKYVDLKKSGSNFSGLSPFTNEKSPSFMVSPSKQIWKCFSSGKGGANPISFLMEHKGLTYPEAIKEIAGHYNIELEFESSKEVSEEERSFKDRGDKVLRFALNTFTKQLALGHDVPSESLSYLKVNRGYSEETIIQWELGYAPDAWDTLKQPLIDKGYFKEGEHIGLIKSTEEGKNYDFFRKRIMFPIRDARGILRGFGGRVLDDSKPKYLNSSESDFYSKSSILYGLHLASNAIRKAKKAYMVEGYTDVISMHQAGLSNTIATCGTSLTEDHIKLLKRYTNHVVILRDGDAAGKKAAERDLKMLLKAGMRSEICILPENEDPDTICRRFSKPIPTNDRN